MSEDERLAQFVSEYNLMLDTLVNKYGFKPSVALTPEMMKDKFGDVLLIRPKFQIVAVPGWEQSLPDDSVEDKSNDNS